MKTMQVGILSSSSYLVCNGVVIAVISGGSPKDPELPLEERYGCAMDWIHLRDVLPLSGHQTADQLPAVGVGPPEPLASSTDNDGS